MVFDSHCIDGKFREINPFGWYINTSKAVVSVTQLITALVSIHSSMMTFLADTHGFLDPPSRTVLSKTVVFFQSIV